MKIRILRVLAALGFIPVCLISVALFIPVYIITGKNTFYWIEDCCDYFCGIELREDRRDNIY
jgi:hypothetical protein